MNDLPPARWRRASVTVNLSALSNNLDRVREYSPNSQIMAVIKANAYGHGMLRVAEYLDAADMLAVAMPAEAIALRDSGCEKPVLVLHGFANSDELKKLSAGKISTVVHQSEQLTQLLENKLSDAVDVWLKVDTGMHRLGISADDVAFYFSQLRNSNNVKNIYLMSHFANADDADNSLNNNQLNKFLKAKSNIDAGCSMANSAAIIGLPESHFDVVRPGIMLYGSSPLSGVSASSLGLQAAMQFESELIDIKQVKAGEPIGYGSTYRSETDITMGIVAAGYGDGYPRHAKNGTPVWINGQSCRLLGRVSMDSLCIDLTTTTADIGDRVVLWGTELSVDEIAATSESIAYELLCNAGAGCV